jgi:hypothetical protein
MSQRYNSEIDRFFAIKYDENGQRINGKCQLCPNLIITGQYTANYWRHLENSHPTTHSEYISAKKRRNNSNDHITKDGNNTDIDNEATMSNDELTSPNSATEVYNLTFKRARALEPTHTQKKLDFPSTSKSKLQKFHQLTAEVFAKLGMPHSIIENKEFRRFLREFEQLKCSEIVKLQSKYQLKNALLSSAAELFNQIIKTLQNSFITLAIDGWTGHKYGAKNTNIIALAKGKSYLLWSDRNCDEKDDTDNYLFPLVHEKIKFLLAKGIAICAITTDNARNMLNVGKELYKLPDSGPVILHLSCSAHTIQLMLQEIVGMEPLDSVITAALAIIDPFISKNGKKLRLDLRKSQLLQFSNHTANNNSTATKQPLKLVLFNQTRWLSRYEAINRLIKLKSHIKCVFSTNQLPNCNQIHQESFWSKLEKGVLPLLKAFKLATNMVQEDNASLLTLEQAITGIRSAINAAKLTTSMEISEEMESAFKLRANAALNSRIQQYILACGAHYAFWAISLLTDKKVAHWESSFGNLTRDYTETVSWIAHWGADITLFYPKHFNINCLREKNAIVSRIKRQIAEFESGLDAFSLKKEYLSDFTKPIPQNSINFDPENPEKVEINWLLFWSRMQNFAPELSNVAVCLFSLGISEASCERSFSVQQLTHSKLRNRLDNEIVEAEMIIRFNKSVFEDYEAEEEASDSD